MKKHFNVIIQRQSKSKKLYKYFGKILLAAVLGSTVFLSIICDIAVGKVGTTTSANPNNGNEVANGQYAVGALTGKFQVTPTGAANYSVDIGVAPGTAGITPQLNISYNSQQDNGLLGMGFSLQGLTGITHCPSNIAQNGMVHGVDYTGNERFCFNGEQLVAIKGAYGADGTEYRTYINTNTRIISYGQQGNGPARFKVWTKGGQVAEYAFTEDSTIRAQGKDTVATWALNKIIDTAGNYLLVKYNKDDANGMYYPAEIDYTGNDAAKLLPYNSVKFIYESRSDARDMYAAGSKTQMNLRLNGIQAYSGEQLVYSYKLVYEQSPDTGRSRLVSIQECAGDGICLPPTKFAWRNSEQKGWQYAPNYRPPFSIILDGHDNGVRFVDVNGDGLEDVVQNRDDGAKGAWINNGSSWEPSSKYIFPQGIADRRDGQDKGARVMDFSGNGMGSILVSGHWADPDDIFVQQAWEATAAGWQLIDSYKPPFFIVNHGAELSFGKAADNNVANQNAKSTGDNNLTFDINGADNGVRFVDLNGDGLMDVVQKRDDFESGAWINNGKSWIFAGNYLFPDSSGITDRRAGRDKGVRFLDLNSDGLPDILISHVWDDGSKMTINNAYINTGNGWRQDNRFISPTLFNITGDDYGARLIDLNGDGLLDIIQNNGSSSGAWLNTGAGWKQVDNYKPPVVLGDSNKETGVIFIDLNGDGLLDIIQSNDNGGMSAWLNTGSGWKAVPNYRPPTLIAHVDKDAGFRAIDLNGDGLEDIMRSDTDWDTHGAWINTAKKPDLLSSVTDGYNSHIYLTYQPITNKAVYTKESGAQFPLNDLQAPLYVVSETQSEHISNYTRTRLATNGLHVTDYTYQGAKVHLQGFGFLGFHKVTATDRTTGIGVTTTYTQDVANRNIGQTEASETRLADGTLIASTQNKWETREYGSGAVNETYYLYYTKQILTKSYTLQGQFISSKTQDIQVDDYTNPTLTSVTAQDNTGSYTTTTKNTYTNNAAKWLIGQVDKTVVTAEAPNVPAVTRISVYSYDPDNGMLKQTISEPDDERYRITTTNERDVYGNVVKTTITAANNIENIATQAYDPTGRFVVQSANALGHTSTAVYDVRFGQPTQTTDPNKLTTIYQYDSFGRAIKTTYPDQTQATVVYNWTDYPGAIYSITAQKNNSPTQVSYYDCLGREIAGNAQGFDGQLIWHTTQYDDLGRAVQQTLPHLLSEQAPTVSMEYDVIGRLIKTTNPNQSAATVAYNGLTVTSTNAKGQSVTKIYNVRNDLIETIDNLGSHTHYYYDAFGNMTKLVDSAGNTTAIAYDKYGHKIEVNDPDKGHWTYTYDPLGQLISQTDALQKSTFFTYDKLGRLITRKDPAGTSGWIYDQAMFGIGKLFQVSGLAGLQGKAPDALQLINAVNDGLINYTKTYKYDSFGRPEQITTNINGQSYFQKYTYDQDSRIDTINYPGNMTVKYEYNNLSFLTRIKDNNSGKLYWQLNNMDANGHVTSETHSNGLITNYTYDSLTNNLSDIKTTLNDALKIQKQLFPQVTAQRQVIQGQAISDAPLDTANSKLPTDLPADLLAKPQSLKEPQGLIEPQNPEVGAPETEVKANDAAPYQQLHYTYDPIDNILSREDPAYNSKETFVYDELNRLTQNNLLIGKKATITTYKYDALGNIIYKSDVGTYTYGERGVGPHAVTSVKGTTDAIFSYNKNGDQVAATINGSPRSITYTSYSKPFKISTPSAGVAFYYNADRESFARVDQQGPASTTTYYMGDFEIASYNDGFGKSYTEQKYHIGPNTIYVVHTDGPTQAKTTHIYETLKDNLGSLTDITDENANLVQHFYYAPFGMQIQTKGDKPQAPITHNGFTGHEEVELVNLIHMKGRIYDPVFGRFLTADPEVQDSENSQALNRYSYCVNNPLRYTDPTGYNFVGNIIHGIGHVCGAIGDAILKNKVINQMVMIALEIFATYTGGWALVLVPAFSAATAAANKGDFADIAKAAAISAAEECAFYGAGNMKAEGLSGATCLEDKVAAQIKSAAVHGAIGGSINVMQGRSFKDGFLAAAVVDYMSGAIDGINGGANDQLSIMGRTAASGAVGGTVAAATGGNFWDGFATGAADRLFNDEAHRDPLTLDEGQGIVGDASGWEGTDYAYAGTKYAGRNAENQSGADCSGSTHAIYVESGYDYPYITANDFAKTSGGGNFVKVGEPQAGDVVSWSGDDHHHLGIYAGENSKGEGMMWTTHIRGNEGQYGLDETNKFTRSYKGQSPAYYRYIH